MALFVLSKNIVDFDSKFLSMMEKQNGGQVLIICDMIKGNESLVENFNFFFLALLSHFDAPITIGYLVTEL